MHTCQSHSVQGCEWATAMKQERTSMRAEGRWCTAGCTAGCTVQTHNFKASAIRYPVQDANYNLSKNMVWLSSEDLLKQETAFILKNANFFVTVMLLASRLFIRLNSTVFLGYYKPQLNALQDSALPVWARWSTPWVPAPSQPGLPRETLS